MTWPKPRQPVARGGTLSQVEGQSTSKCLLATCRSPTEKLSGIKPTSETKEMMGHLGANAYEVEHNTHWSSHSDDRSRQTSLLGRDLFGLRQRGVVLSTDTICMVEPKKSSNATSSDLRCLRNQTFCFFEKLFKHDSICILL